ncbi:MAG: sensor histidine kinase [Chloroflexi bacterium]|nr:sensor histidine kinase [Chloroflexota bacterium]MBV9596699.1 sensor histidine kinase [Chloroflexota bacterium]
MLRSPLSSLRGRLAFTYACLAVLGVAVSALYTATTVRNGLHDRVVLDLADEARLLANEVSEPLAQSNFAAVGAEVKGAETLTHARLVIVNPSGEVVAVTRGWTLNDDDGDLEAALSGATTVDTGGTDGLFGGADSVQVSVPIALDDGTIVGALQATYSVDEVQAIVSRLNLTSLALAIGTMALAAVAGLLLATSVARPAGQVAEAARTFARRRAFGPQALNAFPEPLPEPRGSTDEIRAMVEAFNSMGDQLRVHEQARREFASDVSHELHSLASAMQTAAEALERGAAEANPALGQRLVQGLVGHTRRLVRLADDLLELARWEGGRLRIDSEDVDLAELVRGTLDEWTPEASRRGISLQVRLPVGPLPLKGDPIRLSQALGNLIENALKYAGPNGWVRVDVAPELFGSYELAVSDSGPGIPLDVLPRVFERYFRVEGRASGGPGGMGLGLAIARAIVLAHGGELTAESPRGSGARFVLRLPVPPTAIGPARPLATATTAGVRE